MTLRLLRLVIGLALFGIGCAVLVQAGIGLDPWTVLAEGLALQTGIGIGWLVVITGAIVLLAWIPLRQKPGIGTLANILIVGTVMQGALAVIPAVDDYVWGIVVFLLGIALIAAASGIYLGADLGPGPRDGLMTGLHARLGWPIWVCRFAVEGSVLVTGWLLGGTVGLGTVLFAVLIGPGVHLALDMSARWRALRARRAAIAV
ncbi:hypothetical protein [Microbacterium sp. NPDC079995]|uniref:membrane protein YczE n=1 Tax=unclassified Microbacterium TaxID=2609290 RepID=UPI00344F8DD6